MGEEMTQTMYAHVNKWIIKKFFKKYTTVWKKKSECSQDTVNGLDKPTPQLM
jgi:hypothetical protein